MTEIREIPAVETYTVRHPVLRTGKPIETCRFTGDEFPDTHHFGIFEGDRLAGIVSLFNSKNPIFPVKNQNQLRGMAVLETHRKKGYGEKLVIHAEEFARRSGIGLIWFNARVAAIPFYQKLGYMITGDPFYISDIGEHYVMFKELEP